ncbi:MAG: hypothetical protein JXA99_13055 [Candidatus Lokiarchaeota archaeon]|nr:hypothetical protein [Candidatus Lokiarchaeota archaeon]
MDTLKQRKSILEQNTNLQKRVELPIHEFFIINFVSYMIPLYFCIGIIIYIEYFLLFILSIDLLLHLIIFPSIILLIYYLFIIVFIELASFWIKRWNKKVQPKVGVYKRVLDNKESEEGELIRYYHRRGFLLRLCIWVSSKSPFPWLLNRALRRVGHNRIGKNVIYCNSYVGLEFTDLGDNCFFYPTSLVSSHSVESIFGKLSLHEIIIKKNTIVYPGNTIGPGSQTKENDVIYPNSLLHKNWRGSKNNSYFQGVPAKPINEKKNIE